MLEVKTDALIVRYIKVVIVYSIYNRMAGISCGIHRDKQQDFRLYGQNVLVPFLICDCGHDGPFKKFIQGGIQHLIMEVKAVF